MRSDTQQEPSKALDKTKSTLVKVTSTLRNQGGMRRTPYPTRNCKERSQRVQPQFWPQNQALPPHRVILRIKCV